MKFLSSEKLSAHKYKTPEGYLICTDAILARTGKQTYRKSEVFTDSDDDGEIEIERKAEEVFAPATLASFENKPITVEHPDENVTPDNYNNLSVGFVRDVRRGEINGQEVMLGTLVITDAQTIEEIEKGEHTDLSCGYDCDIVDEANPQQRNIRGNHVALCECGRAGIARIVDSVKDSLKIGSKVKIKVVNGQPIGIVKKIRGDIIEVEYVASSGIKRIDQYYIDDLTSIIGDSVKDTSCKDYYVVAAESGDFWYNENGKEDKFEKARRFNSYEEADRWRKNKGSGSIQKINDNSCKDDIVFDYTEEDLAKAKAMFEKAEDETEKKLLKTLIDKIEFELMSRKQSDSKCKDDEEISTWKKKVEGAGTATSAILKTHSGYYFKSWHKSEDEYFKSLEEAERYAKSHGYIKDSIKDTKYGITPLYKYKMGNKKPERIEKDWKTANYVKNSLERDDHITYVIFEMEDSIKDVDPKEGESKEDFIARFMSETKEEYPDEKQRFAVANSYWERKHTKDSKYTIRYVDNDTVYVRTIKAKSKLDAIKKMKDFQSKELSLKRIEEIPLKARVELDKSKDKKATLIGIESNIDDIIEAADPENKQVLVEKKDKILSDLKKQFNI